MADPIEFPNWKRGASASERFYELHLQAKAHPERFTKMVLIYQEDLLNSRQRTRQISAGVTTTEALGLLQLGLQRVYEDSKPEDVCDDGGAA